jgi:hypothetical protein
VPVAIQLTSIVIVIASTPYTALPNIFTSIISFSHQIRIKYTEKFAGFTYGKAFAIVFQKKLMKQFSHLFLIALVIATTLSSCELVEGIFKAGFYSAIIVIVVIVGLIIWLVSRFRR